MSEPLLIVENLKASYGDARALHGVDFALQKGETLALIGANGAGKSTLIKTITGAVVPDEGTIEVAGHMIEYSGMSFAMFFLAEYANMILVSMLSVLLFLGGWLPPINSDLFNMIPGWIWLGLKTFVVVTLFLWVRATFPRYRYDQIMRLGWKVFIPVTLVWLLVVGIWLQTPWNIWN